MEIIKKELLEMKEKYGDEPRTDIIYEGKNFRIEDTIADEDMVITISHMGYIKRTNLTEYRSQNRGGKGHKGSDIRDADFVEHLFVASMHAYMLFFTEKGKVYWMRVYEIPEGSRKSKGRPIQNLVQIDKDDKVRAYLNTKDLTNTDYISNNYIIMCTKRGIIKKTTLEAYSRPRQNGIIAINIREDDQLLQASLTSGSDEIVLALRSGRAIRFNESKVRPMGRNASGVKGVKLAGKDDEVVGMVCVSDLNSDLLVVSENGYGKRSKIEEYRITNRGGKGVKTMNITDKTGRLVGILNVDDEDDLMIINKSGIMIRMHVSNLRTMGRATQGVRLINMSKQDAIASIASVERDDEEEVVEIDPNAEVLPDLDPSELETENDENDEVEEADDTEETEEGKEIV
jgi:DNA gyrase subunit A